MNPHPQPYIGWRCWELLKLFWFSLLLLCVAEGPVCTEIHCAPVVCPVGHSRQSLSTPPDQCCPRQVCTKTQLFVRWATVGSHFPLRWASVARVRFVQNVVLLLCVRWATVGSNSPLRWVSVARFRFVQNAVLLLCVRWATVGSHSPLRWASVARFRFVQNAVLLLCVQWASVGSNSPLRWVSVVRVSFVQHAVLLLGVRWDTARSRSPPSGSSKQNCAITVK